MKDVYVITGATGGMGSDVAKNITKKGIVLITDLNLKKLNDLKKEMKAKKIDTEAMVCDVSNQEDIKKLVQKVKKLGKFKVMVHTAGVAESMQDANKIFEINLVGTKMLMDAFYEIADDSVFINTASMAGHMVPDSFLYNKLLTEPTKPWFIAKMSLFTQGKGGIAYAFSKKGVILLTEKEVSKWALKNSRIVSISPGAVDTPLLHSEANASPSVDFLVKNSPIPRYGYPKEFTALVKYLISNDAAFVTGSDYLIDGGATSHMKYNDIFGLKKNKIPTILPFFLYILCFMLFPLIFELFFKNSELSAIKSSLLYFFNPAVVVAITMFLARQKISLKLAIMPAAVAIFASLFLYSTAYLNLACFYLVVAVAINIIAMLYNKKYNI